MHIHQQPYRELHDRLHEVDGPAVDVLGAWLDANADEIEWLRAFRENVGPDVVPPIEDRWRLYALSRVIEVLALRFQSGKADGSDWPGPHVSVDEWCAFGECLGLTVADPKSFSAFDCEITSARYGTDDHQPISLTATQWPCLMLGTMLFCRAGVSVVGGIEAFDASIATSSTLYWAYRRKTRPYQDRSHGWGGNSQWRTGFRRDYLIGGQCFFNVDGDYDLAAESPAGPYGGDTSAYPLSREERVELLLHRCFVVTPKASGDLWPYDDRLTVAI